MIVEHYGQKGSLLMPYINSLQLQYHDSTKRVGIINWWWLSDSEIDLNSLKMFVERQDICFFLSEEVLDRYVKFGLDTNNVMALLNQYNVYYILFAEDNDLAVKPANQRLFYYPWFFKSPLYVSSSFKPDLVYREKQYTFNLLLGSNKSYRTLSYKVLKNNNNIYRSYLGHPQFKDQSMTFLDDEDIILDLTNQPIDVEKLNTMNSVQRADTSQIISHVVPEKIYANTHFDIVTETFVRQGHNFLTEKTAKPLATGRFFCWYASPRLGSHLERYGFIFDHDLALYDSMPDDVDRLNKFLDVVKELSSNQTLVKEIYTKTALSRKHNMDVYWKGRDSFVDNLFNWLQSCLRN